MNTRYIVRATDEALEVVDTETNTVVERFDSFTTDTGREIHPNDIRQAHDICEMLNKEVALGIL